MARPVVTGAGLCGTKDTAASSQRLDSHAEDGSSGRGVGLHSVCDSSSRPESERQVSKAVMSMVYSLQGDS